ncbi:MAG: hypothetical protein CMF52_03735 [Legionellales bacterium]|nr:hypothetical protein [Legionellales bacterium]|tara:strand:- start:303 stop:530 length:228 start_codon:yes stop_codon:yes gene_type:complete
MVVEQKPYQWLAWLATATLVIAASLASFVPEMYLHHWFFIIANTLWILVGYLWRENSVLLMNVLLTLIYFVGLVK